MYMTCPVLFLNHLNFSGECGFATANPVTHFGIEEGQKCVIFIPETYNDYTRVYITMRNVQLQPNLRLKVISQSLIWAQMLIQFNVNMSKIDF